MQIEFDGDAKRNHERHIAKNSMILRNLEKIGEFKDYIKIDLYKIIENQNEIKEISEKYKVITESRNMLYSVYIGSNDLNLK